MLRSVNNPITPDTLMITTSAVKPTRLLGLIAVILLSFSSGAFALTARQIFIQSELQIQDQLANHSLSNSNEQQIVDATKAALNLNQNQYRLGVTPFSLVNASLFFVPKRAPEIEGAALTRVQSN